MGLLRLLLALIVVVGHMLPVAHQWGVGSVLAVKAFFILSGFYMALILTDRSRYPTAAPFYLARALRLYPLHWLVLALMVAVSFTAERRLHSPYIQTISWLYPWQDAADWPLGIWMAASNTFFFGSELLLLLCYTPPTHVYSLADAHSQCGPLRQPLAAFLVNPPMWTLGVEAMFYVVAPWIVRRHWRTLAALTVVAVVPRVWLVWSGNDVAPWNRSVAPFELVYFLVGIWAYRAYPRVQQVSPVILGGLAGVVFALTLTLSPHFEIVYLAALTIATPGLFHVSRHWTWDKRIGDLSYPVYCVQFLGLGLLYPYVRWMPEAGLWWPFATLNVCTVLLLAVGAHLLVTGPMERVRERLTGSGASERGPIKSIVPSLLTGPL